MSVSCPHCDCSALPHCEARDVNAMGSGEHFPYFRCSSCGLVFLHPVPADLGRYYTQNYIAYTVPNSVEELRRQTGPYAERLEHVRKFVTQGTLLEIGPSYGAFAYLAKEAGFQVDAIEMDDRCCAFLIDVVGIDVLQGSDTHRALATCGLFDVVALWHVLEHLPDALSVLPELAEHVAPGGILALSLPNPDALQFNIFGKCWRHLDAPRHLMLIPIGLLDTTLAKAGMRRVFLTQSDTEGRALNRFGWMASTRICLSSPIFKYSRYAIALMLSLVLAPWEKRSGRGCAYTVIYQRT